MRPPGSAEIPLTKGAVALVDEADYEWLSGWRWHISNGYAEHSVKRNRKTTGFKMHRMIMGARTDQFVDHINGNPLDNRRCNLRLCQSSENSMNRRATRAGFKGVYRSTKSPHLWEARIARGGIRKFLGMFSTERLAALAYDAGARELHGEFARLNFPEGDQ